MPLSGRSLRQHLLVYTLATLALTLGLVLLVAWVPLRNRLYDALEADLAHEIRQRSEALEEILRRASDLGWQISSRTMARELMGRFHDGELQREEAGPELESKLRDAMLFAAEVHGIARLDLAGEPVVALLEEGLGMGSLLDADTPFRLRNDRGKAAAHEGQLLSAPFEEGHHRLLVLLTPVFAPDGRLVGRDRVLFDLTEIERELARPLAGAPSARALLLDPRRSPHDDPLLLPASVCPRADLLALGWHRLLQTLKEPEVRLDRDQGLWLALAPLPSTGWAMALCVPADELSAEARRWLTSIFFTILGVGLVGLAGSLMLLRPLSDRLLVQHQELGSQLRELQQTKAELQSRSDSLERSNEDLRHFAYATAHDLKSPLITVAGHARLLGESLGEAASDSQAKSLEHIQRASRQMVQLVDDMLNYSRAGDLPLRSEEIDTADLCSEIVASLQGTRRDAEQCVQVGELPRLRCDRTLLRLILQNLIDNGLRYHPPDRPPRIEISGDETATSWRISVRDNGIGIDPGSQDVVFNLFERLHSQDRYPGSGIGLAICRRAAERLDGEILLESVPGEGSTFTLRLRKPAPPEPEGFGLGM
jgi:signal transduction histidine kinase